MLVDFGQFFELYVDDDRYVVPTLRFLIAVNESQAQQMAEQVLAESVHHRGVEVRFGDRRVDARGSFARRSA